MEKSGERIMEHRWIVNNDEQLAYIRSMFTSQKIEKKIMVVYPVQLIVNETAYNITIYVIDTYNAVYVFHG